MVPNSCQGNTGSYWGFPLFDINSNIWQGQGLTNELYSNNTSA